MWVLSARPKDWNGHIPACVIYAEINEYYWNAKVDVPLLELRNLVCVSELIVRSALQRKESRGLHFTLDYPDQSAKPKNTRVATRA